MKYAPTRGCFVMFDMSTNVVLYTMMDGEQKQFAGSQSGSVAPALALRTATDPSSLPLSSNLVALPTFSNGAASGGGVGASSWQLDKTTAPPRSSTWLVAVDNHWTATDSGGVFHNSFLDAQSNNTAWLVRYDKGSSGYKWSSVDSSYNLVSNPAGTLYSGWVRSGTAYQIVGWFSGNYICFTGYGVTSASPPASVAGQGSYLLTSSNVQSEIVSRLPTSSTVSMGFIYDASVGLYGSVTWISQL